MTLIKSFKLTWLSPQRLKQLSFGEITNPKTINARTGKRVKDGLLDPVKGGPSKNFECECGVLKGVDNKGRVCERCGVLVDEKYISRRRTLHITLAVPITNILLFKTLVSQWSKILEIPSKKLEDIIYYRNYVVLNNGLSNCIKKKTILGKRVESQLISAILDEIIAKEEAKNSAVNEAQKLKEKLRDAEEELIFLEEYLDFIAQHQKIKIGIGSEALQFLLREINLENQLAKAREKKQWERVRFLQALIQNKIQPEWMVMQLLPVIPCGLRPATQLKEESTIATTQLNNLYRHVILINDLVN